MPDDTIRQDLPYAKDDPGFRPETLRQINHPGDLGDLDVVAGIVGDFVQAISHDLAHLNPQLSMDDHIQRHVQMAQCHAQYWKGEHPDYAPTRWHQDGACLTFWRDQAGITANTPCEGAYCLLVQVLQEIYRITDHLIAEKITDQQAYQQTAHIMEYAVRALVGLDLAEYQP